MKLIAVAAFLMAATTIARAGEPTHEYFTTSDGIKIHYMQLGDEGSHVVLIHGYILNLHMNVFMNNTKLS